MSGRGARPGWQADIVLHDVDEATGEVVVELVGACVTCPASDQTLKAGIERILKDRVDGVTSVRNVGETVAPDGPIGAPPPGGSPLAGPSDGDAPGEIAVSL